jgi:group I intron endonuclease
MEQKNIGIYKLTAPNGKCYIGQSTNLERRKKEFFKYGKSKKTYSLLLEQYPASQWEYKVLCTCPKSALDVCEIFYIDMHKSADPHYGYNKTLGGKGMLGLSAEKNPMYGRKFSEESIKKMSEAHVGKKNHMFGRFGANCSTSKAVNQYDKQGNFIRRWDSMMDIQRELGIHNASICRCCKGKQKTTGGFQWRHEVGSNDPLG